MSFARKNHHLDTELRVRQKPHHQRRSAPGGDSPGLDHPVHDGGAVPAHAGALQHGEGPLGGGCVAERALDEGGWGSWGWG